MQPWIGSAASTREQEAPVRYMVIETFRARAATVDERFAEHGRMLPPGLRYVDSWIDAESTTRCFQLMETDDPSTFLRWTSRWDDLVAFEIVPVVDSGKAAARASSETILRPPPGVAATLTA